MSYTEAGKAVGFGSRKAGYMLRAYKGLEQMRQDLVYMDKASPDLFSHFEQAWVKTGVRTWLGWDETNQRYLNATNLQLFYRWITEDNEETGQEKLKAQEVRDKLPKVLVSESARTAFVTDQANLDTAYGMALVEGREYVNWHDPVRGAIATIKKIPWTYAATEDDKGLLEELVETAQQFVKRQEELANPQ